MFAGRELRLSIGGTFVAGAQTDSLTINREPINVTDKDDRGVQRLINDTGTFSIEASVEGVMVDNTLAAMVGNPTPAAPTLVENVVMRVAGLGTYSGSFFFSSFEPTGAEGAEALTFSATFMSSGEVEYQGFVFDSITPELFGEGANQRLGFFLKMRDNKTLFGLTAGDFTTTRTPDFTGAITAPNFRFGANIDSPHGLAFDPNGTLYMVADGDTGVEGLYTVSLQTGLATRVGSLDFDVFEATPRGIAIHPQTGDAYFVDQVRQELLRISLPSGQGSEISGHPQSFGIAEGNPQGIAFHPNGTLYGVGRDTDDLFTIDPATGRATQIGQLNADSVAITRPSAIAFARDGTLYLSSRETTVGGFRIGIIYTVNINDATCTRITPEEIGGVGGGVITGLAVSPDGRLFGVAEGTGLPIFIGPDVNGNFGSSEYSGQISYPIQVNRTPDNPSFSGYTGSVALRLAQGHDLTTIAADGINLDPVTDTLSRLRGSTAQFQNGVLQ